MNQIKPANPLSCNLSNPGLKLWSHRGRETGNLHSWAWIFTKTNSRTSLPVYEFKFNLWPERLCFHALIPVLFSPLDSFLYIFFFVLLFLISAWYLIFFWSRFFLVSLESVPVLSSFYSHLILVLFSHFYSKFFQIFCERLKNNFICRAACLSKWNSVLVFQMLLCGSEVYESSWFFINLIFILCHFYLFF